MKRLLLLSVAMVMALAVWSQKVTLKRIHAPAETVFAELMKQAGYNYSYDASLLKGVKVSVDVTDAPIDKALDAMLSGTGVGYSIHGRSVVLKREKDAAPAKSRQVVVSGYVTEQATDEPLIGAIVISGDRAASTNTSGHYTLYLDRGSVDLTVSYPGLAPISRRIDADANRRIDFALTENHDLSRTLDEVVVEAERNNYISMRSASIGRLNLTRADITATPAMFGESDVIKTLQMQPGVSGGVEGLAAMYVHGGAQDENLYMLDNVPLYQVNHFGGLFSAFNTEAIKNVDFYKSSFPARYNGRLSSIMAVNTRDGSTRGHHGSARLGLTSGAFNIDGPIGSEKTTYSFAVRRSWFDAVSVPALAIYNSSRSDKENTTVARYAFMDVNAKISHRFSDRSRIYAMFYYGDDYLKGGERNKFFSTKKPREMRESDISRLQWGNTVGSIGWHIQMSDIMWGELTGSHSHYRSTMNNKTGQFFDFGDGVTSDRKRDYRFRNRINDWSLRADFGITPAAGHKLSFGASYTIHDFLPGSESTVLYDSDSLVSAIDIIRKVKATEGSGYVGYEIDFGSSVRADAGLNAGWFTSSGKTSSHLDPRVSVRWAVNDITSLKLGYSRTSQYVHQLTQSALALPTDQWIPVPTGLGPQRADKISAGFYRELPKRLTLSAEIYYKWMHNLIDYRDDWFIMPNEAPWEDLLCSGSGRAYGLDLMVARSYGRVTGHVAYSLLWADRKFADKNGGRRFPARFDNRHKINVMLTWKINDKWDVSAAWTGMSGNRMTVSTQDYELLPVPGLPHLGDPSFSGTLDYISSANNFRLPFYHRLDLSANRRAGKGMWSFSLYNAYCNMNVIAVRKHRRDDFFNMGWGDSTSSGGYKYKKLRLIPIIPSVSYTWFF